MGIVIDSYSEDNRLNMKHTNLFSKFIITNIDEN